MDARKEFDDLESWTQIVSPNEALQQKPDATTAEKNLLKQDIEKHLSDTLDVLKLLDLNKLNSEKLEANYNTITNKLENDLQNALKKNAKLKKQNRQLKKRLKKKSHHKTDAHHTDSLLLATSLLITKAEEYESLIKNQKHKNFNDDKEYQETKDKLREATTWADHFEKMTIQRNAELIQRNTEIIELKKENATQKQLIKNLKSNSYSSGLFFHPRPLVADKYNVKTNSPRTF